MIMVMVKELMMTQTVRYDDDDIDDCTVMMELPLRMSQTNKFMILL